LIIEVTIAYFLNNGFIRSWLGDFLVVMLMYCFVRTFFKIPVRTTAIAVLIFACVIEVTQYFHLVVQLNLQSSGLARAIMGSSFAWTDFLAYASGILTMLTIENRTKKFA
jgi:hypothetical protein